MALRCRTSRSPCRVESIHVLQHWFIGGSILTVGALAYVSPEKVLRTDGALQAAIEGKITVAEWVKLVGLLNHLVCILLMSRPSSHPPAEERRRRALLRRDLRRELHLG